jgi:hypothetical protein
MSYSFSTNKGSSVDVSIPLTGDATGNHLTIEFSRNVNFRTIYMVKEINQSDIGFVELMLSQAEVADLKDVHYRIKGVINDEVRYFQTGSIDYLAPRELKNNAISIEEIVDAPELRANYVLRDEYVAGAGADPAVMRGMMTGMILAHEVDPLPHVVYDDIPSLRLLFENGLI